VFHSLGEYTKAKEYHQKALVFRKKIGHRHGEADFQVVGEYGKAVECFQMAIACRNEIGDKEGEATKYENLGVLFEDLGEYSKAKNITKKHLRSVKKLVTDVKEGFTCVSRNL